MGVKGRTDHGGELTRADKAAEEAALWHLVAGKKQNRTRFNNHSDHWEFFH